MGIFTTPAPPKVVSGIVGEFAFADVAVDGAFQVIGGEAGVAHGAGFHQALTGAVGVFAAHRAGDDLLEIHLHGLEEMLGQIAAVEADGLVGIVAVVVVPIEQRAGSLAGELQRVHADHAAISTSQALDIRFSLIMLITVQGTTPKNSSSDVQHWMALIETSVCSIQVSITVPSFAIFISASAGTWSVETYFLMAASFSFGFGILHAVDAAEDLGEVDGLDRNPAGFEQFLAIAHGVEGGRARADGADAEAAQAAHYAADLRRTSSGRRRRFRNPAPRCGAWSANKECHIA